MQEGTEGKGRNVTAYLRGAFKTLEREIDARGNEVAERVHSKAGEAAVDIMEDLAIMFRELAAAIDRGEGPDAVLAVRDTMRQVSPVKAVQTTNLIPPCTDATKRGLARQIGRMRAMLAHQDREVLRSVPPAFLDQHDRDLWTARESAETLTDAEARTRRYIRRDLNALVRAWDAM